MPEELPRRETIAAVATPAGRGGIGVVRVSGHDLAAIAAALLGQVPRPRHALLADFLDAEGSALDRGLALYFRAPRSLTGEDVLELQGHGGPVVMQRLLARACELGARLARPGEFTERAFLNDKIDLAQAEAVADLVDSASQRAARSAMRSLSGEFSERVGAIDKLLLDARVHVEAAIDFAEEEIDFLADSALAERLDAIASALDALMAESRQGRVLRDGLDVVIAGAPNVGKSSLMNRLLAEDRAIVTDIPGTTRDLLSADIEIHGIPVRLTDTAGLREGGDVVEALGIERAREAIAKADLVLAVEDDRCASSSAETADDRRLLVRNKVDLTGRLAGEGANGEVRVSALTGAGLDTLRRRIAEIAGVAPEGGLFLARERHLAALAGAGSALANARARVAEGAGDLAAEDLRLAQSRLGEIVGATSADDVLGAIFSGFCIGK